MGNLVTYRRKEKIKFPVLASRAWVTTPENLGRSKVEALRLGAKRRR